MPAPFPKTNLWCDLDVHYGLDAAGWLDKSGNGNNWVADSYGSAAKTVLLNPDLSPLSAHADFRRNGLLPDVGFQGPSMADFTEGEIWALISLNDLLDASIWNFGTATGTNNQSHFPYGGSWYFDFGTNNRSSVSLGGVLATNTWYIINQGISAAGERVGYIYDIANVATPLLVYNGGIGTVAFPTIPTIGHGDDTRGSASDYGTNSDWRRVLIYSALNGASERTEILEYLAQYTGLGDPTPTQYRVRSKDANSSSDWRVGNVITWPEISAVTNLTWASSVNTLSWTDPNSGLFQEKNYRVEYGNDSEGWNVLAILDADTTAYTRIFEESESPSRLKLSMQNDGDPVAYGPTPEFPANLEEVLNGIATGWQISSNYLQIAPSNIADQNFLFWPWDATQPVRFRTRVQHPGAGNCAMYMFIRYVDENNYIGVYSYQGSSDALNVELVEDGVVTQWYAGTDNLTVGSAITYEVIDRGTSIEVWAEDNLIHTQSDVSGVFDTAKKMGIACRYAFSGEQVRFYDLSVEPILSEHSEETVFKADFGEIFTNAEFNTLRPYGATTDPITFGSILVQGDGEHAELAQLSAAEVGFIWDIAAFPANYDIEARILPYINTNQGGQGIQFRSSNANADDAIIMYLGNNNAYLWGGNTSGITTPLAFVDGEWANLRVRIRDNSELDFYVDLNDGEGWQYMGADTDTDTIDNIGVGFRGWYTSGGAVGRDFLDFLEVMETTDDRTYFLFDPSNQYGNLNPYDASPIQHPISKDNMPNAVVDATAPLGMYLPWAGATAYWTVTAANTKPVLTRWWDGHTTLRAWVYADSWTDWSYNGGGNIPKLFTHGVTAHTTRYWAFGPNVDGALEFYYWNGGQNRVTSASSVLPTGQWIEIEMEHKDGTIYLKVDGVEVASAAVSGTPLSNPGGTGMTCGTAIGGFPSGRVGGIWYTKRSEIAAGTPYQFPNPDPYFDAVVLLHDCQGPVGVPSPNFTAGVAGRDLSRTHNAQNQAFWGAIEYTREKYWIGDRCLKLTEGTGTSGAGAVFNATNNSFYAVSHTLYKQTTDFVFWVDSYPGSERGLFALGDTSSNSNRRQMTIKTDGSVNFFMSDSSGAALTNQGGPAGAVRLKSWNELRLIFDGTNIELWLNQELQFSVPSPGNTGVAHFGQNFIGHARLSNTQNCFGGYVGAFRTTALVRPGDEPFVKEEFIRLRDRNQDVTEDGLRDFVVFHQQGDSIDDLVQNRTPTVTGTSGIDTNVVQLGAPTLKRAGTMVYDNSDGAYDLGAWDDFTVEYWFRQDADTENYPELFTIGGWGPGYIGIIHGHANVSNNLVLFVYDYSSSTPVLSTVNYWADGLWHKLRMVRKGSFWFIEIDGEPIVSNTITVDTSGSAGLNIHLNGLNDEIWSQDVRFSKCFRGTWRRPIQQLSLYPLIGGNSGGSETVLPEIPNGEYRVVSIDQFDREVVSEAIPQNVVEPPSSIDSYLVEIDPRDIVATEGQSLLTLTNKAGGGDLTSTGSGTYAADEYGMPAVRLPSGTTFSNSSMFSNGDKKTIAALISSPAGSTGLRYAFSGFANTTATEGPALFMDFRSQRRICGTMDSTSGNFFDFNQQNFDPGPRLILITIDSNEAEAFLNGAARPDSPKSLVNGSSWDNPGISLGGGYTPSGPTIHVHHAFAFNDRLSAEDIEKVHYFYANEFNIFPDFATAETFSFEDGEILWVNGEKCQYVAALAQNGYSGIIHVDPFQDETAITPEYVGGFEAPSDADTWTGWTNYFNASVGTQGVDFDYDTDGDYTRLRSLGTNYNNGVGLDSAERLAASGDEAVFAVIDGMTQDWIGGSTFSGFNVGPGLNTRDGSNRGYLLMWREVNFSDPAAATWWFYNGTSWQDTGFSVEENRFYLYMNMNDVAIYADGYQEPFIGVTPTNTFTDRPLMTFDLRSQLQLDLKFKNFIYGRL